MEAVGHLAAGVAHDFNNLLTVIHGHTSLRLRSTNLDRKVADSLAAVQQAADRAADLTRQLLAFSRKQVMEKRLLCLNSVISNITSMLVRLIPESIHFHIVESAERLSIHADRCNIEQVLLNLVVNARDAMPRGGEIHVSTELVDITVSHLRRVPDARAGKFVCLQVRDTGEGMSAEVLRQIFDPFFTTKETGQGTGMGLATVHGIVQQHDGWIEVVSTPGNGTTFRIHLPLSAPPAVETIEAEPLLPLASTLASIGGRTVLLVEDDADVRALAKYVLEESDLRVIEAPDGPSALVLWEKHREEIDLLLTDMVMPGGLTGADLADRILADRPGLPVIFVSGYPEAVATALEYGAITVPKPVTWNRLRRVIQEALDDSPLRDR